ncbi:MAG: cell division protein FtsZ [Candidatus Zambryskibacteria bacterium]|nr:cell division protein FtsZ [Candidatus Zambryskibacteria bacterium]
MPQIKPEVESFARIKVIGVGGSGKNTINHMINSKVKGVEFIAVNTDAQDLHHSLAKKKIHIGKNLTRGLGTGMNPELGKRAVEETKEEVQEAIKGADMVFVAGGLGGGTASGAAPVVARTAKENGCLTVAVVTKPFFFEGQQRMRIAEAAAEELRQSVDALIIIPNDRLLQTVDKNVTAKNAFAICDNILKEAVEGISELITTPGIINIDFADIRSVLENSGAALMGIGSASGENRAAEAAKAAISSPLLEISINGAKGVLFSIAGGDDLAMFEIQEAAKVITESVDPNAKIIFGTIHDDKLKKGEIRITVIASNFPDNNFRGTKSTSLFQTFGNNNEEAPSKGRIFNTISAPKDVSSLRENIDIKKPVGTPAASPIEDNDDDWSAVPAFLRRSKLK